MTPSADPDAPMFDGVTVLDLTQIYNGPYATFLLARAGATVIKIEPPEGENLRRRHRRDGVADPFASLNANKRAVAIDLKREAGRRVLLDLVAKADVLVENYAPGVMERLGLSTDVLHQANPALVVASGTGYGSSGPYRDYPAMDLSMQAISGVMATTGEPDGPPLKAGPAVCDFLAGVHLYGAIVGALFRRLRTGRGARVEVAMMAAAFPTLASNVAMFEPGRTLPSRTGNRHGGLAISPYNVYPTRDGHLAILAINERHWAGVVEVLDLHEAARDPRFVDKASRVAHMETVDRLVAARTALRDKGELFAALAAARVPCAPVRELAEVIDDPHLHATGMLNWIEHPQLGRLLVHDSPIRTDGVPRPDYAPSRPLGADTADVLSVMLGLDAAAIGALAAAGAVVLG
jgi:CoA:oxalate CoA-transferase